jgi:hypothetical protein
MNYRWIMKGTKYTFSAVLAFVLWGASAHAAPRLNLPETSFDFGYVPQNSTISHVFWMYSTGDDTLKILNVSPG